jgi:hypothetical protein
MSRIPALDRLGDALEDAVARQQPDQKPAAARSGRHRRTRWLAAGVAVAAALSVVLGVGPEGGHERPGPVAGPLRVDPASAEVTVRKVDGDYVIRVGNVLADPEAVRQALLRRGLDVQLRFLPSSPSLVGKLVATSDTHGYLKRNRVRWEYGRGDGVEADFVAVRIPLDYRGQLGLDFGRRAHPGERYASAASSAEEPGEVLHCAEVEGRKVRDVLAILDRRHVYAIWRDPGNRTVPVGDVLDRWVETAVPWAPGQVLLFTGEHPPDRSRLTSTYLASLRRGCPGG